jgi:hypothetical protein
MMEYPVNSQAKYGPVRFYELEAGSLQVSFTLADSCSVIALGDADNDGNQELLGFRMDASYLYEAPSANAFPNNMIHTFTDLSARVLTDSVNDLDNDNLHEIVLMGSADTIYIYESDGNNSFNLMDNIAHPLGVYRGWGNYFALADFDRDGLMEMVTGDQDGMVWAIENVGPNATITLVDSANFEDADLVAWAPDLDQDGYDEFIVAGSFSFYDPQHDFWRLAVYEATANNTYEVSWQLEFYNAHPTGNGITVADLDGDTRPEIVLGFYPNLYIIKNQGNDQFTPVWWDQLHATTYEPFIGQGDLAGRMIIRTDDPVLVLSLPGQHPGLDLPLHFIVVPLGPTQVKLSWIQLPGDPDYYIFRGTAPDSLKLVDSLAADTTYIDSNLVTDQPYWYTVSTQNQATTSYSIRAVPNHLPRLDSVWVRSSSSKYIFVAFDEPMGDGLVHPGNYSISGIKPFTSVIRVSDSLVVITTPKPLSPGTNYTLVVDNVKDKSGLELDPLHRSVTINVTSLTSQEELFIRSAHFINEIKVKVAFSLPLVPDSLDLAHFHISNNVVIDSFYIIGTNTLELHLNKSTPLDMIGQEYLLTIDTLYYRDSDSTRLAPVPLFASITLGAEFTDFNKLVVYPNPHCQDKHTTQRITFKNVTPKVEIRIFSYSGVLVKTIKEKNTNGLVAWEMDNKNGKKVGSGLYFYYITGNDHSRRGKIAIVR